jgi:hypothetical protein
MTAPLDPALTRQMLDHMVATVEATPFRDDPFPHFQARGFVPDDVYRRLLELLPTDASYEPFGYERHQTAGVSNRHRFRLLAASLDRLDAERRTFWYSLRHAFGSRELKQAVYRKLAPGLSLRFGVAESRVDEVAGFACPELFRETDGYSITPHPDTRKKLVTMQFALAADDSQEALGTEFYRRSLNPLAWLREPRGFDTVKRMPFVANAVYAFAVLNTLTLKSWHGRTTIQGHQGTRNSLLNIWYGAAEHANVELAEECGLAPRRSRAA